MPSPTLCLWTPPRLSYGPLRSGSSDSSGGRSGCSMAPGGWTSTRPPVRRRKRRRRGGGGGRSGKSGAGSRPARQPACPASSSLRARRLRMGAMGNGTRKANGWKTAKTWRRRRARQGSRGRRRVQRGPVQVLGRRTKTRRATSTLEADIEMLSMITLDARLALLSADTVQYNGVRGVAVVCPNIRSPADRPCRHRHHCGGGRRRRNASRKRTSAPPHDTGITCC